VELGSEWRIIGIGLLILSACDEDEPQPAQLGELCGVEGPVRLLELAPDQTLLTAPRRIGERIVLDIGSLTQEPDPSQTWFPSENAQQWTVGACGESPTRLDEQYHGVFTLERWPDVPLACAADNGKIWSFAPTGPLDPHVVFDDVPCHLTWTDHGALAPYFSHDTLRFYPFPEDPRRDTSVPIDLPGEVLVNGVDPAIVPAGDSLLLLRPSHELVSIDLRDLGVTLEQTDVGEFITSPSGRHVLSSSVPPTDHEDGTPSPPALAVLHDRQTGIGLALGEAYVSRFDPSALRWADQGYVVFTPAKGRSRVYRLPGLEFTDVPRGLTLVTDATRAALEPLPDGRWITRANQDGSLYYLEQDTGDVTPMFSRPSQVLARVDGGTLVLDLAPCCFVARADDEGAVWFLPDDGAEATRIAERSTQFAWRPRPDMLISLLDIDARRRGDLVLIDPVTRAEQRVDQRVFARPLTTRSETDILRYGVQDGERSGVWQVRLPAE
jgi:hypothetical protein